MGNTSGNCYTTGANDGISELNQNKDLFVEHQSTPNINDFQKKEFDSMNSLNNEMDKEENLSFNYPRSEVKSNGYSVQETINYQNMNTYKGDVVNGKANGIGEMVYKNGDVYKGEFVDDKKEGKGSIVYKNEKKFIGDFKNDVFDGEGEFYFPNGNVFKGDFQNIIDVCFTCRLLKNISNNFF